MSHRVLRPTIGIYKFFSLAIFSSVILASVAIVLPIESASAKPMPKFEASLIARQAELALDALRGAELLNQAEQRDLVARWIDSIGLSVASHLEINAEDLKQSWRNASIERQRVLFAALSQLGVPYKTNADQPGIALDCSALTKFAWVTAGVSIPRGSVQQYSASARIKKSEVQVGDLAWYPGHISISLGLENVVIQSPVNGRNVEVHVIDESRIDWIRWVDPTQ